MASLPTFYAETCTQEELSDGAEQLIVIVDRVTGARIAEIEPLPASYFERRLDETAVAEIVTIASDPDCCEELNDIYLMQEIEWYRDRDENGEWCLAFAGVVHFIRWSFTEVYIQARDFTSWWEHRYAPTLDLSADATDIVAELHRQAMAEDTIANYQLLTKASRESIDFESFGPECRTIKELIDELADYVIDYTAYGRTILVGPAEFFPELPYFLSDEDFQTPPQIEARGPQYGFATRIIAKGANDVAYATADVSLVRAYGLVERALNFESIKSFDDLQKAANSNLALFSNPYYINAGESNSALNAGAQIPFKALIPGIRIGVESMSSCKKIRIKMRLLAVRAQADGSVSVTLEPLGQTDSGDA